MNVVLKHKIKEAQEKFQSHAAHSISQPAGNDDKIEVYYFLKTLSQKFFKKSLTQCIIF